jgi:Zn-dependent peptidase ImmA (M78 family)
MSIVSQGVFRACLQRVNALADGNLPVDVNAIARRLGVQSIEGADLTVDGYVGCQRDGALIIRYRRLNSACRNRFTVAHEIGHLIISEITGLPISQRKARTGFGSEENLANRLAAEILMPSRLLSDQLRRLSPCWNAIQSVRHMFNVSANALLRRATEIGNLVAIFGRIKDREGVRSVTCEATRTPPLYFVDPFEHLSARMLADHRPSSHILRACIDSHEVRIPCQIRYPPISSPLETWVYGWSTL